MATERSPRTGDKEDSHQNTAKTRSGFFPLKAGASAGNFLKSKNSHYALSYRDFIFPMTIRLDMHSRCFAEVLTKNADLNTSCS